MVVEVLERVGVVVLAARDRNNTQQQSCLAQVTIYRCSCPKPVLASDRGSSENSKTKAVCSQQRQRMASGWLARRRLNSRSTLSTTPAVVLARTKALTFFAIIYHCYSSVGVAFK